MFVSSTPLVVFDHLRVPYRLAGTPADQGAGDQGAGESTGGRGTGGQGAGDQGAGDPGRRLEVLAAAGRGEGVLCWPDLSPGAPYARLAAAPRLVRLGGLTFHARVLPADVLRQEAAARRPGERWQAAEPVTDLQGRDVSALCRSTGGGVALPFDPNEVVRSFWAERYQGGGGEPSARLRPLALATYYRLRPLLPRRLQIALRRVYARVQARSRFPAWPLEESLHGLVELVLGLAADVAGEAVPWIAPWPGGRAWALVLTHDVETARGLELMPALREVEERRGYVSSWNFVPRRYDVPADVVTDLIGSGCEVGVHGLYHDGRDLESARTLAERLPEMQRYARAWGAVGFRSPATQRDWDLISTLPFEYDSSYPDSDPFEPQNGGCCSWWPFPVGDLVELPITLPQDHTLFVILRRRDAGGWLDKAEALRQRGGMALLITHPDYVRLGPVVEAYDSLLARYADDPTTWRALPRDVARWWRRRAGSAVRPTGDGWEVVGPAAGEAVVRLTEPAHETGRSSPTTAR
jgi:hypothetical protein